MTLNRYECIGNLGRDVEVKSFQSGDKIATFSVATTERFKDRNGDRQENTEWSTWTVRGGLVDVAEKYLRKGSKVFLAGKKRTRKYTDRDGIEKTVVEFAATDLTMLDSKPETPATNYSAKGLGYQEPDRAPTGYKKRGDEGHIPGFDPDLDDEMAVPF